MNEMAYRDWREAHSVFSLLRGDKNVWTSFGSAAGSGGLAMCFYRGNRVRDRRENPVKGRAELDTELQRKARPDAQLL
jgi:hypothetical protein